MRPGDRLDGRFELRERAGAGGMGEVFQALDTATGRLLSHRASERLIRAALGGYLTQVPTHARLLALARERLGDKALRAAGLET